MANLNKIAYASGHPDIALPEPQLVEIGTAFTAAVPQSAAGWTFNGWYTDRLYQNKWIDGTVITGDLNLYGKWTEGSGGDGVVNFAYSNNSDDTSAGLPGSIDWPVNTKIYPSNLPSLPVPTSETTIITGWYVDAGAEILVNSDGVLVPETGITLYAKANNSGVISVSFDYAIGREDKTTDDDFPMPETAECAWDAEILGDNNVLPKALIMGEPGDVVELPKADEMEDLLPDTECEAKFKGWFADPLASGKPLTEITLGEEDTKVYALYEPVETTEYVDVTYKVANVYVPEVNSDGEIIPSEEKIPTLDAVSLMPDLPCEFVGEETRARRGVRANETENSDYEWHDTVVKGSEYRLALPDTTTGRTTDYEFAGYYKDINCEYEQEEVIESLNSDITVYCKFVPKSEVALPTEDLPMTYNITYEVDGFAADSDIPSGGLMPPDLELPDATSHQPVDIDEEAFPDLIDPFIPDDIPACEGFDFKGWYFYDVDGEKVDFEPGETNVESDLVLHPEFEMLELNSEAPVQLVELTPDTLGAPEDLTWHEVPMLPFAGMTNPIIVDIGSTFNVSTIELPELEDTFEVEGYYRLELVNGAYVLVEANTFKVTEATTLYVKFRSTLDEPIDVVYHNDESTIDAQLIAPDFDYELAAATQSTGGFAYEPRPADVNMLETALVARGARTGQVRADGDNTVISGYYSDPEYTQLFDPDAVTAEGETIDIYPKVESLPKIMVTVDYVPRVYSAVASNFKFEIPTAPELPLSPSTATTYLLDQSSTGPEILSAVGQPPTIEFWRQAIHEYGNCYWYTVASATEQVPQPFNPVDFTLTEPITLYPQFEADMSYQPEIIERDDIRLTLTTGSSGAASVSVNVT